MFVYQHKFYIFSLLTKYSYNNKNASPQDMHITNPRAVGISENIDFYRYTNHSFFGDGTCEWINTNISQIFMLLVLNLCVIETQIIEGHRTHLRWRTEHIAAIVNGYGQTAEKTLYDRRFMAHYLAFEYLSGSFVRINGCLNWFSSYNALCIYRRDGEERASLLNTPYNSLRPKSYMSKKHVEDYKTRQRSIGSLISKEINSEIMIYNRTIDLTVRRNRA